jgi:mannose-6-phosphate isomerase
MTVEISRVAPYPLRIGEIWKPKIWGGRNLETVLGKEMPEGELIGESWEVSDRPGDVCLIENGLLDGVDLHTLVEEWGGKLLGSATTVYGRFPLLYKFIDANLDLSVQVHPDDALALEFDEPDVGKTEMWYVIASPPGGNLIFELNADATAEAFRGAVDSGSFEPLMVRVPVCAGDALFVAPGTVHAICEGIVLAEIQQNSDLTYRVYDWGRVGDDGRPRALHIEKAVTAISFGHEPEGCVRPLSLPAEGASREILAACKYFATEKIEVDGIWSDDIPDGGTFRILSAVGGSGSIESCGVTERFVMGNTFIVPASAGTYAIEGSVEFLKFYVPVIEMEIVSALRSAGHDETSIRGLAGMNVR